MSDGIARSLAVNEALSRQAEKVVLANEKLATLLDRINPILGPSSPCDSAKKPSPDVRCEMAARIITNTTAIEDLIERINSTIARLEI